MRASDKDRVRRLPRIYLRHNKSHISFEESPRVLVRPIGLGMVEVGGSNKHDQRSVWSAAAIRRRPQDSIAEAVAIEDIPPGPNKLQTVRPHCGRSPLQLGFHRAIHSGAAIAQLVALLDFELLRDRSHVVSPAAS